ncbi:S41 family peptidase [Flavobacterium restrictum]|uniref:Peptidase S41 n=1 Tax=Flavobacterium restrictum TaxID=2594428 RepID=A0A553E2N2_9FLAO|nr:S41 family peptidase [Flavobacterium restrictum]TRX39240.1 peptidase S41 [Flavobacterium restrictum]
MKTTIKFTLFLFVSLFIFQSCQDNDDVAAPKNLEIQNFIWKGMNQYYLWQSSVPNLADDKFANQEALNTFLSGYSTPEELFDALRVAKTIDRFSWIVDDYLTLEQSFQGTTKNNGVDFGLSYKPNSTTEIFGYVRYILPNSDASTKAIKRGDMFTAVNGTQLTVANYQKLLLEADSYTLNLAYYNGTTIVDNGKSVALTKTVLNENPIFINKVITAGTHKIGYMMYNGFFANYDTQLNEAFGTLKEDGKITDLVLDLRYNGGGSVQTATRLASMITGQFTGQIFAKQQWNEKVESYYSTNNPDALKNFFTDKIETTPINMLKLTKIYILTTGSTASASELVINGLKPFIDVVQIGDKTIGKNVGSITLYDSPTFGKENRNPNHKYAMQPLVLKIVNAAGFGDYQTGLVPTYQQAETISTFGVLGDTSEPLLSTAISKITGTNKIIKQPQGKTFDYFKDAKAMKGLQNQMYLEKAPEGLLKALE